MYTKIRLWIWVACAAFFFGVFLITTLEVRETTLGQPELIGTVDQVANTMMGAVRSPQLNSIAIDITALGSGTVLTILSLFVVALLTLKKQYFQAIHFLVAAVGSAVLTSTMKTYFERSRPSALAHLVDVQGYSYPSGHSLSSAAVYFTFAVLLFSYFKTRIQRSFIIIFSLVVILLIALSRVYLGVHYLSDVIAGIFIGISWSATLAATSAYFEASSIFNPLDCSISKDLRY